MARLARWILAGLCLLLGPGAARADVRVEGERVVAESAALRAVVERGVLVSLVNKRAGMEMLASGTEAIEAGYTAGGKVEPAGTPCRVDLVDGGAVVTRRNATGEWRLRVRLDAATGDLLLDASATASQPGLSGVRVAAAGPDWRRVQLAAPVSAQGMLLQDPAPGSQTTLTYCGHRNWEAQILLFEPRSPAGGGLAVWAEEGRQLSKSFTVRRDTGGGAMWLAHESIGAPEASRSAGGVTWRFTVFQGDWRPTASRYREWMRRAFLPQGWHPPAWTEQIGAFITLYSHDPAILDTLAKQVDPAKTLLVLPRWRRPGYDSSYPDYTPAEGFEGFCRRAHALGFRVMVHFNTFACTPSHPAFARLEPFVLRDRRGSASGYFLENPKHPMHFLHIHPGCSEFRKMLVDAARDAVRRCGIDAIHLDESLVVMNHSGGLVEGLTMGEGKRRLVEELLEACPGLALGGEEHNEGTLALSFTQRTPHDDEARSQHPIGVFLFGPSIRYYSHYAFTIAGSGTNSEAADVLRTQERSGVYPTFAVHDATDVGRPAAVTVARIARAFQEHGLRPCVDQAWPAETRFCWRSAGGDLWPVLPTADGARLASGGRAAYERRSDLDTLRTTGSIPGWPAFGEGVISGLDPTRQYVLSTLPPTDLRPRFLSVSERHTLARWQLDPDFLWADLDVNRRRAAVVRLVDLAEGMRTGVLVQGTKEEPLGYRAAFERQLVACGKSRRDGFFAHPPWERIDGWGQVFAEFDMALPKAGRGLLLDWYAGIVEGARSTDGTTYLVTVDGREVFRRHNPLHGWHRMTADLSAFAGRRVRLRLITDPGPERQASWDLSAWGDPIIRLAEEPAPLVVLPGRAPLQALDGTGRPVPLAKQGDGMRAEIAAPGTLLLRFTEGRSVALPFDLLAGEPQVGQVSGGEWLPAPQVAARADRHCGGAVRAGSVGAHPPPYGQTAIQYLVKLPAVADLKLDLGYGVCGDYTHGVSFQVAVNRRTIWRDDILSGGYRESEVSLTPFAGQDVLLELVTDSLGDAGFDWAIWGQAMLR